MDSTMIKSIDTVTRKARNKEVCKTEFARSTGQKYYVLGRAGRSMLYLNDAAPSTAGIVRGILIWAILAVHLSQ